MVTVTVNKAFRDLREHVDREAGSTFAASPARAEEIAAKLPGYITYEEAPEGPDLKSLTVAQLRAIAAERDVTIPKNASKARLIELLEA